MHALCEPKMLRFAKLHHNEPSPFMRIGRFACLFLAFLFPLWSQPKTAIFIWSGAFSLGAVAVSLSWAAFARLREVHQARIRSGEQARN